METHLKIGELAKLTGITVRTLHYYDEVGLLKPDYVTDSGHRLYSSKSFSLLYRILTFKDMGFSLEEIKELLTSEDSDILGLIEIQLLRVQDELAKRQLLFGKLIRLKHSLEESSSLSAEDFQEILPYINTSVDLYFTKEQLNKLKQNHKHFNTVSSPVSEWMDFISDLEHCSKMKLPKTHPAAVRCINYWKTMTSQMAGTDEQMIKAMASFHSSKESSQLKYGLTEELYRYLMSLIEP